MSAPKKKAAKRSISDVEFDSRLRVEAFILNRRREAHSAVRAEVDGHVQRMKETIIALRDVPAVADIAMRAAVAVEHIGGLMCAEDMVVDSVFERASAIIDNAFISKPEAAE